MEWYRVFYWTAKLGGLTHAANKLNITQPAVSHTIKQLESSLGGALFFRTSKGVTLTTEGEVLYQCIAQAFQSIELGEKKLAEMQNLQTGEINIGASDTLCKHYLLPYLEQFHHRYPEIKIRVTNRTTPETIKLLKEGAIDFGIVNNPTVDPKVSFQPSAALEDCLVGNERYTVHNLHAIQLDELSRYPLLLLEQGTSSRDALDQYTGAHGITLQPEFEQGSIDLLIQFALRGFGLTIVAKSCITAELDAGKLIEIPLHPPIPKRHIGIATLKGIPLSAAANRFLEFLLGHEVES